MFMLRSVSTMPRLPVRPKDSHKGTFGTVVIIAGSVGMSGAAVLSGTGALRAGAGLVHVACPLPIQPVVAMGHPCYLTLGLPVEADGYLVPMAGEMLDPLLAQAKTVAIGPGLGRNANVTALLDHVLHQFEGQVIVDADGLYALHELIQHGRLKDRRLPLLCTPHPGEFAMMTGLETKIIQGDRKQQAVRYANEHKVIMVLKGQGTIVTDGQRIFTNNTGNAGMAKGGSGDVLTGVIAALSAQGMPALEAAQVAVHVHGIAGDLASAAHTEIGMLPTDMLDALPAAFRKYVPTV